MAMPDEFYVVWYFIAQNLICKFCSAPLEELKPSALLQFVMPGLRGSLDQDPDSTSVGFVLWIPACTGMTAVLH
jgi:hypothetical protein